MLLLERRPLRRPTPPGTASSEQPAYPLHQQLLVGDTTSTYAVADQTHGGHEEAFGFVAVRSGSVRQLKRWVPSTPNPGINGLALGILADNAGLPGAVLSQGQSGPLPVNDWLTITVPAAPVVAGTKYWLVHLPLGENAALFHFPVANAAGPNVEGKIVGRTQIEGQAEWVPFNEGPTGFYAIGLTS